MNPASALPISTQSDGSIRQITMSAGPKPAVSAISGEKQNAKVRVQDFMVLLPSIRRVH